MRFIAIGYGLLMLAVVFAPLYCLIAEVVKRVRLGKAEYARRARNEKVS